MLNWLIATMISVLAGFLTDIDFDNDYDAEVSE